MITLKTGISTYEIKGSFGTRVCVDTKQERLKKANNNLFERQIIMFRKWLNSM